jgi:hypothetical protein
MRILLEAREPRYRLADYVVETDRRAVEEVAGDVVGLARSHGGWPPTSSA